MLRWGLLHRRLSSSSKPHRLERVDIMKAQLEMAQEAYTSNDKESKRRVSVVMGSAVFVFSLMYGSYCLSDVTSDLQLARMYLYKHFYTPHSAFKRLRKLAKRGSLPVDLEIDRPWMQSSLCGLSLVNACGGPPCDPMAEWALPLIRMGCGFTEIGPVAIGEQTPADIVPPQLLWENLSFSEPSLVHAWCAPSDVLTGVFDAMQAAREIDELTVNGIIGIEVARTETLEESCALLSRYADYLSIRVDDATAATDLVARIRRRTNKPIVLKMTLVPIDDLEASAWLDTISHGGKVGIIVDSVDAVKAIRRRNEQIVIIMANVSSAPTAVRAVEAGAHCFQLSTEAFIDGGPRIVRELKDDFRYLLNVTRGHTSLEAAIGKSKRVK